MNQAPPPDRARSVGADVVRFGSAMAITLALGVVQVFVLPRQLDLTTYGEYRLFLVWVTYLGAVQLGIADGAFVRWAGRPAADIRAEWPRVLRWLLALQFGLLAAALVAGVGTTPRTQLFLAALAACALGANVAMLAGYALQAAGDFRSAGVVAVLTPASFVTAIVIGGPRTLVAVLGAQVLAMGVAGAYGVVQVHRLTADPGVAGGEREPFTLRATMRVGLPVQGAQLAAAVSQFADRLLVSLLVPVESIALYGFASTVAVAAGAATQTLSRVMLAHAAWRTGAQRARVLGSAYDMIAAGFGVALLGLPAFEHAVARAVPAYVPALPVVRALVLGVPVRVAMHVVQVGTLQSYGLVRRQFALELGGAALVAAACAGALALAWPLWGVAAAGSVAGAVAWGVGASLVPVWVPDARDQGSVRFAVLCAAEGAALAAGLSVSVRWEVQTLACLAFSAAPTTIAIRSVHRQWNA